MAAAEQSPPANSQAARHRRVLILGLDGVREDALIAAKTPAIDQLTQAGTWFTGTRIREPEGTDKADTVSGPGWSNLLTGVWPDKHQVLDNKFTTPNYEQYPHFFARLKEAQPKAFTASYSNWSPISEKIVSEGDINHHVAPVDNDYETADVALMHACIEMLAKQNPDVTVLYLGEIDEAGHKFGFHPKVPEYMAAIERVDAMIAHVLRTIADRSQRKDEEWLVIVCTDHGGRGKNHGGGHEFPEITQTWMIVSGDGALRSEKASDAPTSQVDIVSTTLTYLGIPLKADWNLDGRAVGLQPQ